MQRWRPASDHYYWLTAYLAARGMQKVTCRVVAFTILGLGIIPVAMLLGPAGAQTPGNEVLAFAVTGACLAGASLWMRPGWPSRTLSQACVVIGSGCIAASCLIPAQPYAGLIGSTAFVLPTAFVAFFHAMRLLVVTWTLAFVTLCVLIARFAGTDLPLALSTLLLVALICICVAFSCRLVIRLVTEEVPHVGIDPLTGLLNEEGFAEQVAVLMGARDRNDDRYLVLVVVNLDNFSLLTEMRGAAGANEVRIDVSRHLRESVRREAVLAHVGDAEFLIADVFTTPDASPLAERVRSSVANSALRMTVSVGVVTTPLRPLAGKPPYDLLEELRTIATTAMYEVRRTGGNLVRQVVCPQLTALDRPDDGLGEFGESA
jgi:diguanylate cyclase (GGDEF)-like protein